VTIELTLVDPLSGALNTIYNNERRHKRECIVMPASKLMGQVLRVMQKNGYIGEFEFIDDGRAGKYRIQLLGRVNKCGVIKPRYAMKVTDVEDWEERYLPSRDVGVLIVSTPKGVLSHVDARSSKTGGRLLAYIY
jgi:small subunit ribosomal protein S8